MTLRTRLVIGLVVVLGITGSLFSFTVYEAVKYSMIDAVDRDLARQTDLISPIARQYAESAGQSRPNLSLPPASVDQPTVDVRILTPQGRVARSVTSAVELQPEARDSQRDRQRRLFTRTINGQAVRFRIEPLDSGYVLQTARSMVESDRVLDRLVAILAIGFCGLLAAGLLLAAVMSRSILAPVTRLRKAIDRITRTGDLSGRSGVEGKDEIAAMGRSFDEMMDQLQDADERQRRFLADASHELRTPLACLHGDLQVLAAAGDKLPEEDLAELREGLVSQSRQLTRLVGEMTQLAADREGQNDELLDLAEIVREEADAVGERYPHVQFTIDLRPHEVVAPRGLAGRAVRNLMVNAAQHSPHGATVTLRLRHGAFSVTDEGDGFDPRHAEQLFDRFWRADRSREGSGLGLAMVADFAALIGGRAHAENVTPHGARFTIDLPPRAAADPSRPTQARRSAEET